MSTPLRIVFYGSPAFAVPTLRALATDPGAELVAAYTQPARPAGRGRAPRSSPVEGAARGLGLPIETPERLRGDAVAERLRAYRPDAVVLAAYGLLVPPALLDVPRLGWLNVHPSLLPRWRGASPVVAPILAGDPETGVSIFLMRAGLDDGAVLIGESTPIGTDETAGELSERLAARGAELLIAALHGWARGELEPREQDHEHATYAPKLSKADAALSWELTAEEIARRVRAYNPWPVAHTHWGDRRLRILRARALGETPELDPGAVYSAGEDAPVRVRCGEGVLELAELQLEGGRAQDAAAFLRGRPDLVGARLG